MQVKAIIDYLVNSYDYNDNEAIKHLETLGLSSYQSKLIIDSWAKINVVERDIMGYNEYKMKDFLQFSLNTFIH